MDMDHVFKILDVKIKSIPKEFFDPKEICLGELIGKTVYYRGENFAMHEKGEVKCSPDNRIRIEWDDDSPITEVFNGVNFCQLGVEILEKCTLE